jgi:hypothetical protein
VEAEVWLPYRVIRAVRKPQENPRATTFFMLNNILLMQKILNYHWSNSITTKKKTKMKRQKHPLTKAKTIMIQRYRGNFIALLK